MAAAGVSWKIIPVSDQADQAGSFRWMWEETKNGAVVARSATSFQYYNECVEDAQKRGYSPPPTERLR